MNVLKVMSLASKDLQAERDLRVECSLLLRRDWSCLCVCGLCIVISSSIKILNARALLFITVTYGFYDVPFQTRYILTQVAFLVGSDTNTAVYVKFMTSHVLSSRIESKESYQASYFFCMSQASKRNSLIQLVEVVVIELIRHGTRNVTRAHAVDWH